MPEITGRPSTRLEPATTWTVVTDSPLKGLSFAREAGTILAWDEGNQLYLLNTRGESLSTSRVPNRIITGAISDEGSLIALLVEADGAGLLLLSADFDVLSERPAPSEASFVTIDPHGRYLAVGTRHNALHLINRHGRPAGRLETMEPLSHLCFVPGRPLMVGAAAFGMLVGIELEPEPVAGRARSRDHLARPIDVQCRPAGPRWRREHDSRQLLYPGHSALRSDGAKRGLLPPGRDRFARRPRLPRPHDRGGDPRRGAGPDEFGRQRALANPAGHGR